MFYAYVYILVPFKPAKLSIVTSFSTGMRISYLTGQVIPFLILYTLCYYIPLCVPVVTLFTLVITGLTSVLSAKISFP